MVTVGVVTVKTKVCGHWAAVVPTPDTCGPDHSRYCCPASSPTPEPASEPDVCPPVVEVAVWMEQVHPGTAVVGGPCTVAPATVSVFRSAAGPHTGLVKSVGM